jgi:hypothetical protein
MTCCGSCSCGAAQGCAACCCRGCTCEQGCGCNSCYHYACAQQQEWHQQQRQQRQFSAALSWHRCRWGAMAAWVAVLLLLLVM